MNIPDDRPSRHTSSHKKIKEQRSWFYPPDAIDAEFINPTPSIVLAEADDLLREIFTLTLTNRGCKVRSTNDGDAAWKLLNEAPFDLLITNDNMPGLAGLDFVRKMRAASLKHPVILISRNMPWDSPDFCDLLSPGAAMEKPFGLNRLIATVCGLVMFQSNTIRASS